MRFATFYWPTGRLIHREVSNGSNYIIIMAPIELIRKFIPTKIRIKAYVWAISIAGKSKLLLYPFLYLLHGHIPEGITIVDGKPLYRYKGIKIESPRDSIEAYVEVFMDDVYDYQAVPKMGNVVIDIGAYVGMYSIKASKAVGPTGKVIAVEPLPDNFDYLDRNVEGLANVRIVNVALSNYVGSGKLYSSPSTAAHSMTYVREKFVKVRVTTLDELVKDYGLTRVDYIKMDAEGSDLKVLSGAREVLQKHRPVLSIACYHTNPSGVPYVDEVMEWLECNGYNCITKKGYIYAQKERV